MLTTILRLRSKLSLLDIDIILLAMSPVQDYENMAGLLGTVFPQSLSLCG